MYQIKEDANFRQANLSDWNTGKSYYYKLADQYLKTYSLDD